MDGLIQSIITRPYVFAFLAAFLFLGMRFFGWRRTLLWLVTGYAIAWLSELSSITNGFPYGEYHYVYEGMPGELVVLGVPFFDSLSYPFLTFAGFTTAVFMLGRRHANGTAASIFLGALLTMLLDVIVDPTSTMGERWFLGRIHYYAHPGWYFGVPLTNFGGWFLVSLAIIAVNAGLWRVVPWFSYESTRAREHECTSWMFPAFYAGIALFIIAVTFSIGELKLGAASLAIIAIICVAAFMRRRALAGRSPQIHS